MHNIAYVETVNPVIFSILNNSQVVSCCDFEFFLCEQSIKLFKGLKGYF